MVHCPSGRREYDYWPMGVINDEYLSEDWYFCDRYRSLGGKIWCHTAIRLRHTGPAIWPLAHQTITPLTPNSQLITHNS